MNSLKITLILRRKVTRLYNKFWKKKIQTRKRHIPSEQRSATEHLPLGVKTTIYRGVNGEIHT